MAKLFALLLLLSAMSVAESPFDGTWIVDADVKPSEKPTEFLVSKGVFRTGTLEIRADGQDHEIKPTEYSDAMNVRIVDEHTVEVVSKKAGKAMFIETETVSADGNTLIQVLKDTTESEAVTFVTTSRRIALRPTGAHLVSGSWQAIKTTRSKNGSIISYKCTAEGFSAETPLGEKLVAKFDGKYYPIEDDPWHTMVSVKLIDPNTIEQANQRNGKVVFVVRLTITLDGKTIHASSESKEDGSITTWELHKQP
jgi:hypothetical protein